jgi:lysozyme
MRPINAATVALIKSFESCVLDAYQDAAGKRTIGWGHLCRDGDGLYHITQDDADAIFESDLRMTASGVDGLVKVPVTENERGALISFAFNLGVGALGTSTLLRLLNAAQYYAVPQQLERWIYAGGKPLDGLIRRRQAEARLWSTPDSEAVA